MQYLNLKSSPSRGTKANKGKKKKTATLCFTSSSVTF